MWFRRSRIPLRARGTQSRSRSGATRGWSRYSRRNTRRPVQPPPPAPPGRARRGGDAGSTNRRCVHQSPLRPERVDAALEAEGREVRFERLAVVPDLLDDVERPAVIQREHLADVAGRADEALHGGILARERLVDRLRGEA